MADTPTDKDTADGDDASPTTDAPAAAAAGGRPAADETGDTASEVAALPSPAARPSRAPMLVALLAVLVAAAALGGVALLWVKLGAPDPALSDTRASLQRIGGQLDDSSRELSQAHQELAELEAAGERLRRDLEQLSTALRRGLDPLEGLPERLAGVESSLAALQGISSGLRDAWLLAEAEYYLQIANAQLDLAGNPEQARIALELADQRLASLANPALTGVRRAIADELQALRAIDDVDVEGTALAIASLADAVAALPLRNDVVRPDTDDPAVSGELSGAARAWASLKASLSDVVSVRRSDAPVTPLLPPDAAFYLRRNIELKLEAARLALLTAQPALFGQSLADAATWLREYFDTGDRGVSGALATLDELAGTRVTAPKPDISGSLALLRQYMARRVESRTPPAAGETGPAQ